MSSKSENRQRTKLVALRLLPREYERLRVAADARGISVGQLVRDQLGGIITKPGHGGGGRPSAQTVALREHIITALRGCGSPITTDQVVALAHPSDQCTSSTGECVYMHRDREPCPGHCWKPRIYNSLRALERKQVVLCHRPRESYAVFWSAATDPTDGEMNAILDALEVCE